MTNSESIRDRRDTNEIASSQKSGFVATRTNFKEEVESAQEILRAAYARRHDLNLCVVAFVSKGMEGLNECCAVKVGAPLQPLLASPCRGIHEVVQHFFQFYKKQNIQDSPFFTAEFKYDGQRAQIHWEKQIDANSSESSFLVRIFSRHLDCMTEKFTSIVKWLKGKNCEKLDSFIIDAEICAVKRNNENAETVLLPFQVLSTIRRSPIQESDMLLQKDTDQCNEVALCVFAFDLIFLNGISLINTPLYERKDLMMNKLQSFVQPGYFEFAKSIDVTFHARKSEEDILAASSQVVETFLLEAIGSGRCEGLMLKSLSSLYTSHESREKSGGCGGWRKLKKDYIDSLSDSIDVVPIGAWRGSGRKSRWFSPFLLAVYNAETGDFESLCRCMSGFTDVFYQEKYDFYSTQIAPNKPDNVSTEEDPSFWFIPTEVWEIRGADLTLSPVHHAAKGLEDAVGNGDIFNAPRGISLRFPRFVRARSDKSIKDATTSNDILSLFLSQSQRTETQT